MSKVLIYRYFTDLNGLLSAWALKNNYWTGQMHPRSTGQNDHEGGLDILQDQAAALFSNPVLREVEKWLLIEKTDSGKRVMENLEKRGRELCRSFLGGLKLKKNVDGEAVVAILAAGITYLALKSDTAETYNGVPLRRISGLERINNAIESIISNSIAE